MKTKSLKGRIADMQARGASFMGYGGSAREYETAVFSYRGAEVRIPRWPSKFSPDRVEREYACISGRDATDVDKTIDDMDATQ